MLFRSSDSYNGVNFELNIKDSTENSLFNETIKTDEIKNYMQNFAYNGSEEFWGRIIEETYGIDTEITFTMIIAVVIPLKKCQEKSIENNSPCESTKNKKLKVDLVSQNISMGNSDNSNFRKINEHKLHLHDNKYFLKILRLNFCIIFFLILLSSIIRMFY